jgi:formylglycine-generating enzyme required for sulfatase activity
LADAFAKKISGRSSGAYESWDDGNALHAEVGRYRPNGFGLHDVHGNVWEWCSSILPLASNAEAVETAPADESLSLRVSRGGSYYDDAWSARAAYRFITTADFRDSRHGVRPVRSLSN